MITGKRDIQVEFRAKIMVNNPILTCFELLSHLWQPEIFA